MIDQTELIHVANSFSASDAINEIGGFVELLARIGIFLAFSVSKFSFHLKAISKLFLAKTVEN